MQRGASLAVVVALTAVASEAAADPIDAVEPALCADAADRGQRARKEGKLQDARDYFLSCAAPMCPDSVQKDCLRWANDTIEILPSIVIDATDDEGHDIGDARVIIDGYEVASVTEGRSIAIDPGHHVIRVERGGYIGIEQKIIAKEGMHARRIAAVLGRPRAEPAPNVSTSSERERTSASTPAAWTFGAMGVGAAVMTAGLLLVAGSAEVNASSERDAVRGMGWASIAIGGCATIAGLFGYFSEPAKSPKRAASGITVTPVGAFGRF